MMNQPSDERNRDGANTFAGSEPEQADRAVLGNDDNHEPDGPEALPPTPPASGMAVLSLLCTMVSVGSCCVSVGLATLVDQMFGLGVLVAPAAAIVGVVLGFGALVRIKRSSVPLLGRPLAIAGMFIGIIALILQGAIVFGAVLPLRAMQQELVPVADFLAQHTHNRDLSRAKGVLAESSFQALEAQPERFEAFAAAMEQAVGTPRGADLQLSDLLAGRRLVEGAQLRGVTLDASVMQPTAGAAPMPRPVQLVGDQGRATLIVFLDEEALEQRERVLVLDVLLVVSEESWTAATLLEDGPAAAVARGLGLQID